MKKLIFITAVLILLWSCESGSENTSTNTSENDTEVTTSESNKTSKEVDFINITSKYTDNDFHMTSGEYKVNILNLEEEFTICDMSYSKNGSAGADTDDYVKCFGKIYHRWDDAMNDYYKQAKPLFGEDLKKAQLSWLKFRDAEVDFVTAFYQTFNPEKTLARVRANLVNVNLVEMRTYDLIYWLDLRDHNISDDILDYMDDAIKHQYGKNTALINADEEAIGLPGAAATLPFGEAAEKNNQLLNDNYKQLTATIKDKNLKAKLKTTQRAWIEFRDAELALPSEISFYLGGNSFKEGYLLTEAKMDYRRAMDLKAYTDYYQLETK